MNGMIENGWQEHLKMQLELVKIRAAADVVTAMMTALGGGGMITEGEMRTCCAAAAKYLAKQFGA